VVCVGAFLFAQKLRQLRDIRRDPPRLIFREQLGRPAGLFTRNDKKHAQNCPRKPGVCRIEGNEFETSIYLTQEVPLTPEVVDTFFPTLLVA
jgi:hypothetical protein